MTATETMTDRLIPLLDAAAEAAGSLCAAATEAVKAKLAPGGKIDNEALEREEHVAHGLSWLATYAEGIRQMADYAKRTTEEGRFGELESLLTQIVVGEYLAQLSGGVVMSQGEIVRLHELGVPEGARDAFLTDNVVALIQGVTPEMRARAAQLIQDAQGAAAANFGDPGLEETYEEIRNEMRRFFSRRSRSLRAGLASEGRVHSDRAHHAYG
ncbi:MAG: hypothetical protein A49_18600 [Methyloceanibacter sp.]|nr:MAG: hypothetical protein A49_18600 [Methyloceanibacter sp.]